MSSTPRPTVIVVDDNPSIRRALRLQLSLAGYRVQVFESAQKFLDAKCAPANTCLLLDIYMPGKSGIELWQQLAAAGRGMPRVLMSGHDDDETETLARSARGVMCLFKPFDQSALLRAIQKSIDRQSKHDR